MSETISFVRVLQNLRKGGISNDHSAILAGIQGGESDRIERVDKTDKHRKKGGKL
jgi:hypothetical protein